MQQFYKIYNDMIKDKKSLIDKIQSAVADYCYDCDDPDFTVTAIVSVENGWVTVEIKEE